MSRRSLLILGVIVLAGAAYFMVRRSGPDGVAADITTATRTPVLQSFVTASGEIVATRYADIGSASMGRVVALMVKEGDRVKAGQVLARIDPVQAGRTSDAAASSVRALEAEVRGADNQVRVARAEVEAAQARAADTRKKLARANELRAAGLTPQADLDAAQSAADAADAQVRSAEAAFTRAEQAVEAASRRVAQGRAEAARARDSLAKTEITAPIAGIVTRLDVEEGEMVVIGVQNQPGSILMTVSDLTAINAEVKVAEADVLRLGLGNTATVTLEAAPGQRFSGKVVEIGASALPQVGTQAAAREFKVTVRIEGTPATLRPGLTCDAEILVAERKNVLTVPLQAVVQRPDPGAAAAGKPATDVPGVFIVRDGVAQFAPARIGIIGGLSIEVDGLPEGASIVSGPFQVLRELASGSRVTPRVAATR